MKRLLLALILLSSSLVVKSASDDLSVMSLNIYGWKTMPQHSGEYANIINAHNIDVLSIQEGSEDWQLSTKFPTDYSRAKTLKGSLGDCWARQFQIYINQCNKVKLIKSGRFDLSDGPNATRTGEFAEIEKSHQKYLVVNVHWDHESQSTRIANANETAALIKRRNQYPTILLGDFNSACENQKTSPIATDAKMVLLGNAGIDCIFIKGLTGTTQTINSDPSDHPGIIARLSLKPSAD